MNSKKYNWINNINAWIVFFIAFATYAATAESSASLWDCGEFISGAYKLQVVHPPGAPLFLMLNRVLSLLASNPSQVAYVINIVSGLSTAFAILFLYWIISSIAKRLLTQEDKTLTWGKIIAIQGSAWVGALACTFSDTIWFSAVEGEVYALSTFFISILLWTVVKWENAEDKYANRWLVLAAYLIGLSIGVHLMGLLVIPVGVLLYYFKKYKPTIMGFVIAFFTGFVMLGIVQFGVIQILTSIASKVELFMVNSLGLPYFTGIGLTYGIVFLILIAGMIVAQKYKHVNLQLIFVSLFMIIVGFSSYLMVPIRAAAQTPINMNDPQDIFSLMSYLNREQYGERPLVRGPLYTANPYKIENAGSIYFKDTANGDYGIKGTKSKALYREEDKMLFPRMAPTNDGESAANMYQYWANFNGQPTFADNMAYFFNYQVGYMYWRYFMWNFAGRQDDYQGTFENQKINGDWLSGISFIDDARLGSQKDLPKQLLNQKARNTYYLLPLLFGLFGLLFMIRKNKEYAIAYGLLFLTTGLFLTIYFNSPPREPRERDYVLVGSFYTFCIWIGLAIAAAYDKLKDKKLPQAPLALALSILGLVLVPLIMAKENYNDHDRSGRTMARDFATNYLESCPPNAILFTAGDNDTYPLWYAQEVDGIRPDVRVMNTSLAQIDWYLAHMQRKENESDALPFYSSFTPEKYLGDERQYNPIYEESGVVRKGEYLDVDKVINFVMSDNPRAKITSQSGNTFNYIPTKLLKLGVNKEAAIKADIIPEGMEDFVTDTIKWTLPGNALMKDELAILALVAGEDWSRPICFANTVPSSKYLGLDKYMVQEGLIYRFVPIRFDDNERGNFYVNDKKFLDIVQNKFRYGNIDKHEMFMDENSARIMNLLKLTHLKLAEDLSFKGKTEESFSVLEQVYDKFKYNNAPYYSPYNNFFNFYNLRWIELYYRVGHSKDAEKVYSKFVDDLADCMRFYQQPNLFARKFQTDYESAKQFVASLEEIAKTYNDATLQKLLSEKFPLMVANTNAQSNEDSLNIDDIN
ncbi:MAG: DUF2723 domain-containing protein [Chitinophagales bacterium]|nr:DUF2723 domain-containing protein [Chitinophagales bacterium]